MVNITIASPKGGCGKSSTTIFLALALNTLGYKVLVIDMDHNNNTTDYFLRDKGQDVYSIEEIEQRSIYQFLTHRKKLSECFFHEQLGLTILPATPTLARLSVELANDGASALRLGTSLMQEDFDYCIIDTPPALCLEMNIALYTADFVICPVQQSRWTIQGFSMLKERVENVGESKVKPPMLLALPSIVSSKEALLLRNIPEWLLMETVIERSLSIKNAGTKGEPLRQNCHALANFQALAKEVEAWN